MLCHYCTKPATQNIVWLKNKQGEAARIMLPHCGCDILTALRKYWPSPNPIKSGVDYVIESLTPIFPRVTGNGITVDVELSMGGGVFSMPKLAARELARKLQEAAQVPEPGCDDATDHWRGHCGCK